MALLRVSVALCAVVLVCVQAINIDLDALANNALQMRDSAMAGDQCDIVLHLGLDDSGSMSPKERDDEREAIVKAVMSLKTSRPNAKIFYHLTVFGTKARNADNTNTVTLKEYTARPGLDNDLRKALAPNMGLTCHGCIAELMAANIDSIKGGATAQKDFLQVAIIITDGVTTVAAPAFKPQADKLRAKGVFGMIFIGADGQSAAVQSMIKQTSAYKATPDAQPTYLGVADTHFGALGTALGTMISDACTKTIVKDIPPPEIVHVTTTPCKIRLAIGFDISRSILTRTTAAEYRSMVKVYAENIPDPTTTNSVVAIFGFAGNIYKITEGWVSPAAAAAAMEQVNFGVTNLPEHFTTLAEADRNRVIDLWVEDYNKKPPTGVKLGDKDYTARKIGYVEGADCIVANTGKDCIAKDGTRSILRETTLIGMALNYAITLFTPSTATPKPHDVFLLVTDGTPYDATPKCNTASGKVKKAHDDMIAELTKQGLEHSETDRIRT